MKCDLPPCEQDRRVNTNVAGDDHVSFSVQLESIELHFSPNITLLILQSWQARAYSGFIGTGSGCESMQKLRPGLHRQ